MLVLTWFSDRCGLCVGITASALATIQTQTARVLTAAAASNGRWTPLGSSLGFVRTDVADSVTQKVHAAIDPAATCGLGGAMSTPAQLTPN